LFFVLSKTIGIALLPANFLIGIGLLGAAALAWFMADVMRHILRANAS